MRAFAFSLAIAGGCVATSAVPIAAAQTPVAAVQMHASTIAPPAGEDAQAVDSAVTRVRDYVVAGGRNAERQFIVIDKQHARLFVFSKQGDLEAESPILLGAARGDFSVPGIGERSLADVKPHEKTTPAGSFFSRPGRNLSGEDVIWVDYESGVSMHRVRATNPAERRLERLASETYLDNRISFGCINVPKQFFERAVWPVFEAGGAWVYVLPETMPVDTLTTEPVDTLTADGTGQPTELTGAVGRVPQLPSRAQ